MKCIYKKESLVVLSILLLCSSKIAFAANESNQGLVVNGDQPRVVKFLVDHSGAIGGCSAVTLAGINYYQHRDTRKAVETFAGTLAFAGSVTAYFEKLRMQRKVDYLERENQSLGNRIDNLENGVTSLAKLEKKHYSEFFKQLLGLNQLVEDAQKKGKKAPSLQELTTKARVRKECLQNLRRSEVFRFACDADAEDSLEEIDESDEGDSSSGNEALKREAHAEKPASVNQSQGNPFVEGFEEELV